MNNNTFDVILIGYGPVSESLALMLSRQGRSVAIFERWTTRYRLPRAVCVDHELYRVLAATGLREELPSLTHPGSLYQWFNAQWQELLVIDWGKPAISGGPEINFVHQPTLETALDEKVQAQPTVSLNLGWEAIEVTQDENTAQVTLKSVETGEVKQVSARYIVGCDGANSLVRRSIGSQQEDRGFQADWLVVDVLLKDGVTVEGLGIPEAGQYCNPDRPTTIVPAGVRDGKKFRRWEFMRLPGETVEDLEQESYVWKLLEAWAGPDEVELVRHKVYNFRSLIADRWRDRRLMIAGDAAHVMPPFLGQGMCAGLRDSWNLAWKLGLILDGKADDSLLDSYQIERLPHVSQIIDMAIFLGKIICIPDPEEAANRDRLFLEGRAPAMPPFPQLISGLLRRDGEGQLQAGAGLLSPHSVIKQGSVISPLDEVTGAGSHFVIISRALSAEKHLSDRDLLKLEELGVAFVNIDAPDGEPSWKDVDGRIHAFLDAQGWSAMIIRPDFYVFGGAVGACDLPPLVEALFNELSSAGVKIDDRRPIAPRKENA
ncbi:bifunctional 3-(3-hydroxy-phenyl)propionate/3-hydroxycinnamic acid hydroxylase [Novosphingobium sp. RL4]|uniref:bifunctional 3-(3-hydroxy-phenyl)propionate/3-hydroxycinnamic acid hydroxylase MhpA n=1 Tax=Novosphingobium sp. RL4 TaxID=3109595 RepID=UPI002D77757F|nr:bifunctional 3-(3-hydroxy-phenyl)propionate/3-hydroxycinnamic acid hydroxylase [Novosphingobium sp. RL4]WRT94407.1 bifunctional 3-(3-hydroxy-phenyl)propionate/3-hydroxycinnamic acid hydroxylase [Novosphingobium sp. RL4]